MDSINTGRLAQGYRTAGRVTEMGGGKDVSWNSSLLSNGEGRAHMIYTTAGEGLGGQEMRTAEVCWLGP